MIVLWGALRFVSCGVVLPGLVWAISGDFPNLETPGAGTVEIEVVEDNRVVATSDYWRLEFDLRSGGVLDTIVFHHGSGKNLLVEPLRTYVDRWEDQYAPAVRFEHSKEGSIVLLQFSGRMGAAGRAAGPVSYQTQWRLSPYVVRADHQIELTRDLQVSEVGVGSTALRADLDEYGLRTGPDRDPSPRKQVGVQVARADRAGATLIAEHHAPIYLLFFDRGVEGLDFQTASNLGAWETGLAGRGGVGCYRAEVSDDGRAIEVLREPLKVPLPSKVAKGAYTFSYYLGLPRIVEKSYRKWRHLSFNNQPWPPDEEIAEWAENGVNLVRLHNDYADNEDFWHDGDWPPYSEEGMAGLRRVIAACHRHGIQVVPYFSMQEYHPDAVSYQEHEQQWKRTMDQAGTVFHNYRGKGEFGAQMCLLSGWLDRRKKDIETAYRELGFDGIYFDWMTALPCNHPEHRDYLHLGTDGVIDLLAWTRRLIGEEGVLILHSSGWRPSITFENFGNLIVNMENLSMGERMMRMEDIPITGVLGESAPRSPCPSYRADRARERTRSNIAHESVMGLFPWAGGKSAHHRRARVVPLFEETMKLFRTFKPYRLEEYKLHDAHSEAVRTGWEDVYGAVYSSPEMALVVLSNTASQRRKNIVWRVSPETLGIGSPATLSVKDTVSGRTWTISLEGLTDGSLVAGLDGYEYRLFEIRSAQ